MILAFLILSNANAEPITVGTESLKPTSLRAAKSYWRSKEIIPTITVVSSKFVAFRAQGIILRVAKDVRGVDALSGGLY